MVGRVTGMLTLARSAFSADETVNRGNVTAGALMSRPGGRAVSGSPYRLADSLAGRLLPAVDIVCLGAMEMQREQPDPAVIAGAERALRTIKDVALRNGLSPVIEAALLVEESFSLAETAYAAPAPYLAHFVTAIAADLARVVQATIRRDDPSAFLAHARASLRSMPRDGADCFVEVDLADPEQVARVFAAVDDASDSGSPSGDVMERTERELGTRGLERWRELRRLVSAYTGHVESLRQSDGRDPVDPSMGIDVVLASARAIRASAAAGGVTVVERVAGQIVRLLLLTSRTPGPPDESVLTLLDETAHFMARVVSRAESAPDDQARAGRLAERAVTLQERVAPGMAGVPTERLRTAT